MDPIIDSLHRFWSDLSARSDGPMSFRFYLQPTMAFIAALHDGIKDARTGRAPYFWHITHADPASRKKAWREGITATTRILLLGVGMDVIYQFKTFGGFKYPVETLVIALLLAFVPYLLLRGPVARIASWWTQRHSPTSAAPRGAGRESDK